MNSYLKGVLVGSVISTLASIGHQEFKYRSMKTPKYAVGTCLSNGLFYEKVVGIRTGFSEHRYELQPFIQGKMSAPSTTPVWIVDEDYVKINEVNCKERK